MIRIIQIENSRLWIWFGLLAGVGLMNKHSTVFFGAAVVLGLLLTKHRREFLKPWIWIGGAVALLVFMPNLFWQVQNHFPTLEDLRNVANSGKNIVLSPKDFILQQILIMNPILLPVWLAGLWYFLLGRGSRYRVLGWTYLALLVIFIVLHGKNYYLAPSYPMLLAGGGVAFERWLSSGTLIGRRMWPRVAAVTIMAIGGIILAPLALPLLPPEKYVAYQRWLGLEPPKTEVRHQGPLPQLFGDQFGWPELVAEVAHVYNSLPPEERAKAAILTGNYGEAGAINLFGPRYGLPTAISGHQTHFLWGPRDYTGEVIITLQYDREDLEPHCASVQDAGAHYHPWGMVEENAEIYICRGLDRPLQAIWPKVKHWN
ncbi:MAG TPA: glycosyltransferase family 39 protein, partial [Terriglobales bacterium]